MVTLYTLYIPVSASGVKHTAEKKRKDKEYFASDMWIKKNLEGGITISELAEVLLHVALAYKTKGAWG